MVESRGNAVGTRVRFGVFDVDLESGDVRKNGVLIRLHDKPFQVLQALLEKPGDVVSRKDLQDRLWPGDTLVEFENGLNNAISRLRDALGDSADSSRFIQTVPRRGYRFIAPVQVASPALAAPLVPAVLPGIADAASSHPPRQRGRHLGAAASVVIIGLAVAAFFYDRSTEPAAHPIDSVAVLPFATATEETRDDYIAFGMTEALIAELSRVAELKVISQTSAFQYKGTQQPLTEIARDLGVGAIVEGSVVDEGAEVRITVQLIDARTDTHLWTETYRRAHDRVLATQRQLARTVADEVRLRLTGGAAAPRSAPPAVETRAHEAYLKGRYFLQRRGEVNLDRARSYFEEAIAVDPRYAPPLAGLADFYILTDSMAPSEAFPKAKAYAIRSVEADGEFAGGHAALGYAYFYGEWNWERAERAFERALEIDSGDSVARYRFARVLVSLGRFDEARVHITRALTLDPLSITVHDAAAMLWFNARDYERMIQQAARILELDPRDYRAYEHGAVANFLLGRHEEALAAAERGLALLPDEPLFLVLSGLVQHRMGRSPTSLTALDRMRRASYVPGVFLAIVAAQTGRPGEALELLEKAHADRDPYLVLLNVNPWFDPLREQPRFQALVRAMRFPVRGSRTP
jgi:TolB-like protein/DNA-binding winged helix-turn-helix (wHTH) protein